MHVCVLVWRVFCVRGRQTSGVLSNTLNNSVCCMLLWRKFFFFLFFSFVNEIYTRHYREAEGEESFRASLVSERLACENIVLVRCHPVLRWTCLLLLVWYYFWRESQVHPSVGDVDDPVAPDTSVIRQSRWPFQPWLSLSRKCFILCRLLYGRKCFLQIPVLQ